MLKTWVKAGVGSVLLWASACTNVPLDGHPDEFALEPPAPSAGRLEARLANENERGPQAEQPRCDPAELQQLEAEARELANAGGCTDVSQCRTAPVGVMACGGPRDYLVYCSVTTNERELQRALERLARREARFNRQCDRVSICIFIPEPEVELVNGECREVVPSPLP